LLVPGYTGSKEDFIALLEPLAQAGFRTVAVDGRGQHESGGPREERAYAQEELAQDVLAQALALGDGPVHLLGHSLGGLISRAAVLREPSAFLSLTLMSSGPAAISAAQQARTKLLADALVNLGMEDVWQAMRRLDMENAQAAENVAEAPEVPDAIGKFLHQRWLATLPEQLIATGRQLMTEPDRVPELAALPLPKHVLSGVVDHAWPVSLMDEMAERLGAHRTVIEGAEHSPNADQPEATARALSAFWTSAG
jgi:pimeloyl-ACP methyl ester carboxylesterase